jgi:hypothetical protein
VIVHDITPTATPLKTRLELELEDRAAMAISEYRLVKDGVISYSELGYGIPGGGTQNHKLLEYLIIDSAFNNALEEKARR